MKVIIAGSRSILDSETILVAAAMSNFRIDEVVSGGASGVDKLGEDFAVENDIVLKRFPADWVKYGKGAGYRRNAEMAEYADALIAVWDGKSKGTLHMINCMKGLNKPVFVYTLGNK